MPRLSCICGESINLSLLPNPQGFQLIWEPLIETITAMLVDAHEHATDPAAFAATTNDLFYRSPVIIPQLYECPTCGRLAVFAHASDMRPAFWFQREPHYTTAAPSLCSLVEDSQTGT